jgi:predicted DNA-binding ribbon-helix-helix protein
MGRNVTLELPKDQWDVLDEIHKQYDINKASLIANIIGAKASNIHIFKAETLVATAKEIVKRAEEMQRTAKDLTNQADQISKDVSQYLKEV